uniref:RNA-directed DNA polymerase, eukaryota n=1 Tax=Tanacetum cinerariifolium TaxID=118510 RepID=A0A6L2N5Y8_TANCI|nr:RNA-directed DNA polymerase, eukaryota [Tanacetum cinerariifolium]
MYNFIALVLVTNGIFVRRTVRVEDMDCLIDNLYTLWVGRFHLHANVVRYERSNKPPSSVRPPSARVPTSQTYNIPGSVKELNYIPNLCTILTKEGFADIQLSYLSGLWLIINFKNEKSERKLLQHKGVHSWFHVLQDATHDFGEIVDIEESPGSMFARKRIFVKTSRVDNILETFKVIFKGKNYMVRAKELFTWTPCFLEHKDASYISKDESILGNKNNTDNPQQGNGAREGESEDEGVSDTIFGDNPQSPCNHGYDDSSKADVQHSEDLFGFYDLLKKPPNFDNVLDPSLSHHLGFTPKVSQQENNNTGSLQQKETSNDSSLVRESSSKGLINRWKGQMMVLGEFNEVRFEEEIFGSIFNQSCARDFNHFISSSGLLEVKMEGYSFTWSYPSATKISKLDCFLVSKGIILTFPAITAVCLDRYFSDHRPIILNEIHTNFGPTPFWIFHSWFKRDGFDAMVE